MDIKPFTLSPQACNSKTKRLRLISLKFAKLVTVSQVAIKGLVAVEPNPT